MAETGNLDITQLILKAKRDNEFKVTDVDEVKVIATDKVKINCDVKVNIDVQDGMYWTPLHVAASAGHTHIAQILIEMGE